MMPSRRRGQPGFTLIDLMVTITVIVIVAMLVVPALEDDHRLRLIAASRMVASDIELAQVMTIANPQSPTVVRFQPGAAEYWLASQATPDDPIQLADGVDYRVLFGQGKAMQAQGVTVAVTNLAAATLEFNAQGGLEDLTSEPEVTLTLGSHWIKLSIAPTTGSIFESSSSGL